MRRANDRVFVILAVLFLHDTSALTTIPAARAFQARWISTRQVSSVQPFSSCSSVPNTNLPPTASCQHITPTRYYYRSSKVISKPRLNRCLTAAAAAATSTSDDSEKASSEGTPQLTVAAASLNLIKAIVGSGVLALPSGVAAMSDFPRSLIPASIFLAVLGSLSAYTFGLYGRICHVHQAKTLGEAWEKEFGTSPWLLSLGLFLFCGGAALTYNIVVGDTFSSLATSVGITGWLASRHASILLISMTTLLPLCSLKALAALAPVSLLGVIGVLVTTLFMAWRCLSPTSPYRLAPQVIKVAGAAVASQRTQRVAAAGGASFLSSLSPQFYPKFNTYSKIISPSALILAAMAATAFTGHFSAPDFYHSLRGSDEGKFTLTKYHLVTAISFASVAIINILILSFGFLTFGGNSAGIILNNYSTLDKGASLCRFLMALSVIGGYPFLISACKIALLEVLDQFNKNKVSDKDEKSESSRRRRLETFVTRALVAIFTGVALVLPNAGFVISFNGALLGSIFCYVLPAILFLSNTRKSSVSRQIRLERLFSYGLVAIGSVAGLAGGAVSILNAYFPQVLL